jgi:hypothetical protein
MALAHRRYPTIGLQFHPESILTDCGYPLLAAYLRLAGIEPRFPIPTIEGERVEEIVTATAPPTSPVTF